MYSTILQSVAKHVSTHEHQSHIPHSHITHAHAHPQHTPTHTPTHTHAIGLRKFRLALVQLAVGADKAANLQRASQKIREAAENGAQVVALPVSN